jgi:hypothetical protein
MQNVNLHARVMGVIAPRKFERNGKAGRVCSISIADESGETTLVLWHKDVELVERGVIEKGDIVDVLGAYVKEDAREVHLPMGGQVLKVKGRGKLPEVEGGLKKIEEMEEGMSGVDFVAEVLEVEALNSFEKGGKLKQVSSLLVADSSGRARLTLWDSNAELVRSVRGGDVIKVENGYVKNGLLGRELHADWRSRVIVNPRNVKLQEVEGERIARMPIAELKEGKLAEVEGSVVSADAHSYEVCNRCKGTAREGVCTKCSSHEITRKFVVNALLRDESGGIGIVLFGKNAQDFLGVRVIPEDVDVKTILELKRKELTGRKIVVRGNARRSRVTDELEFVVNRII